MGIALCPVPEQKTAKHRVHIDVHTDSVDTAAGARGHAGPGLRRPDDHWTVLLDPDGGELCTFVREEVPAYQTYELVVDSVDAERMARWWGEVFGVEPKNEGSSDWWIEDVPGMPFESMVFDSVPEPKTVKNRVHWDVYGDVGELIDLGATRLRPARAGPCLADPEGNEFCVFPNLNRSFGG